MILDSISVGLPKEVEINGKKMLTSIFKEPVMGAQEVTFTNIIGDKQSDLNVHGGPTRAISVYASEYYSYWKEQLGTNDLPWGYFGENLNISGGVFEETINVGDRFTIGTVELEAVQSRFPCVKLGYKMGSQKWVKPFLHSGKTGFYFGVIKEGTISPGDQVTQIHAEKDSITIAEITDAYLINKDNKALLEKAIGVEKLTQSWKDHFIKQLESL